MGYHSDARRLVSSPARPSSIKHYVLSKTVRRARWEVIVINFTAKLRPFSGLTIPGNPAVLCEIGRLKFDVSFAKSTVHISSSSLKVFCAIV